jgi:hypothetical protein
MFTFELICMLLEGYLKIITLRGFFWDFKNNYNLPSRLSLRRQIVSAGSTCVNNFLAQAEPA